MAIVLTTGDDNFFIYEGFLGGTSNATLTGVNLATVDGGAGTDTVVLGDTYPNQNFTLTVSDVGVVTLTAASGHTTFQNFEVFRYSNKVVLAVGSSGDDSVNGGSGNDPGLYGLAGNDVLNGGAGADVMLGGAGSDTYLVDNIQDSVRETTTINGAIDAGGIDTVKSTISYTLGSFVEKLALIGASAINGDGNALNNALTGNDSANVLSGNAGNDAMHGGAGNDNLDGGAGNDKLEGGTGNDQLWGGAGHDVFQFTSPLGAGNIDTIGDWKTGGTSDRIQLDDDVFTALGPVTGPTTLAGASFFAGTAAHDASDRIIYDASTGALYYDPDGTGATAQVQFATLGTATHPPLSAGVFEIIP